MCSLVIVRVQCRCDCLARCRQNSIPPTRTSVALISCKFFRRKNDLTIRMKSSSWSETHARTLHNAARVSRRERRKPTGFVRRVVIRCANSLCAGDFIIARERCSMRLLLRDRSKTSRLLRFSKTFSVYSRTCRHLSCALPTRTTTPYNYELFQSAQVHSIICT